MQNSDMQRGRPRAGVDLIDKEEDQKLRAELAELRYRLAVRRGQAWNVGKHVAALC